jgi:hypothetical protein
VNCFEIKREKFKDGGKGDKRKMEEIKRRGKTRNKE